ncbi:hypothetical protein O8C97_03945 [Aliarcobacter butzleri]|uniref:hypothetical protein n=1 Tax=Aliarcobacter butzleri TaxID=28197 RepID=UPI00263E8BAB|nr:hypothetical protein [Aliarcobacter butzleri]MDN5046991.1 hypothetical protein [Aliarcobacter butzleri]
MLSAYMPQLRKPYNNSTNWYKSFYNTYYLSQITNLTIISYMNTFYEMNRKKLLEEKYDDLLKKKIIKKNKNKKFFDYIIVDDKKLEEELRSYEIEQGFKDIFNQAISNRAEVLNTYLMFTGVSLNEFYDKKVSIDFDELVKTTNGKNWYQVIQGFLNIWEFLFLFSSVEHTLKDLLSLNVADKLFSELLKTYEGINFHNTGFLPNSGYEELWKLYVEVRNLFAHTHGILSKKSKDKILSRVFTVKNNITENIHIMDSILFSKEEFFPNKDLIENKYYLLKDGELNLFRNFIIILMETLDEFIVNK